jgi:hypothetical protein
MGVMTSIAHPVRASDAEREEVARRVQAAGGDGRLTLAETEERLAGIYDTRFRHELTKYTEDLPNEPSRAAGSRTMMRSRSPLAVHAAIVLVLGVALIARWVVSGVPYFWPAVPLFWLVASLVLHARIRGGGRWHRPGSSAA